MERRETPERQIEESKTSTRPRLTSMIPLPKITVRNIYRFFGLFLVVLGLSFYVGWSIIYGTWTDIGLYSFVAPVVVFGLLTLLLMHEKDIEEERSS
ncbi:MAG: hypothetical protein M1138_01685 [Candidatus Thermoplasmatota archaeon]|jgi:hypothetical protein|nr:hypothetical protein [Candidatus Thermoplasmatota archaeon]